VWLGIGVLDASSTTGTRLWVGADLQLNSSFFYMLFIPPLPLVSILLRDEA
jgi:hypothetical protein